MSSSNYRPSNVLKEGYKLQVSSILEPITIKKNLANYKMFTMGLSFFIFLYN